MYYSKQIFLGTLAYVLVTFPLAITWHIGLFEETYKQFGYFEGEPSFVLGFLSMLVQGAVLSFLYPYVQFSGQGIIRGIKYALLIGLFFWTSHVLAFLAKQSVLNPLNFLFMESFYLLLQFGFFGIAVGFIYQFVLNDKDRV